MKFSELRGIAPVFSDFVFCEFSIDGGESHLGKFLVSEISRPSLKMIEITMNDIFMLKGWQLSRYQCANDTFRI